MIRLLLLYLSLTSKIFAFTLGISSLYLPLYFHSDMDAQVALGQNENREHSKQKQGATESQLKERISHLAILSQSMWELPQANTGFTNKDILKKLTEINLRDGRKDGKNVPQSSRLLELPS